MLLERLYQGLDIPNNTKTEHVLSLHDHLVGKLKEAMEKRHIWLAACTLAVNAGMWKGRRLRRQRQKLLCMINKCRSYLRLPYMTFHDGWESEGIYDGYGAIQAWRSRTGQSVHMAFAVAAGIEDDIPRMLIALEMELEDRARERYTREALIAWSEERK